MPSKTITRTGKKKLQRFDSILDVLTLLEFVGLARKFHGRLKKWNTTLLTIMIAI